MIQIVDRISGEVFYNKKDSLGTLGPFFCFEPAEDGSLIHHDDTYTLESVLSMVKSQGGFVRYVKPSSASNAQIDFDDDTEVYSQPSYSAAKTFVFTTNFIAAISVSGSDSRIVVSGEDRFGWWSFHNLLETSHLATPIAREFGKAPSRYAYIDQFYVSEVNDMDVCGVDADFYIQSGGRIQAVAGIRNQAAPWCLIPHNEKAAKAVNLILKGEAKYEDEAVNLLVRMNKTDVAIVSTQRVSDAVTKFKEKFQTLASQPNLDFSMVSSIPQPSYVSRTAQPLFYLNDLQTLKDSNIAPTGYMYYLPDCSPSGLDADFAAALQGNESLSNAYCFRAPNALNEILTSIGDKINQAKQNYVKQLILLFNTEVNRANKTLIADSSDPQMLSFNEIISLSKKAAKTYVASVNNGSTIIKDSGSNRQPTIDLEVSLKVKDLKCDANSTLNQFVNHLNSIRAVIDPGESFISTFELDSITGSDGLNPISREDALAVKQSFPRFAELSDQEFLEAYYIKVNSFNVNKTKLYTALTTGENQLTALRDRLFSLGDKLRRFVTTEWHLSKNHYGLRWPNQSNKNFSTYFNPAESCSLISRASASQVGGKKRYQITVVCSPVEYFPGWNLREKISDEASVRYPKDWLKNYIHSSLDTYLRDSLNVAEGSVITVSDVRESTSYAGEKRYQNGPNQFYRYHRGQFHGGTEFINVRPLAPSLFHLNPCWNINAAQSVPAFYELPRFYEFTVTLTEPSEKIAVDLSSGEDDLITSESIGSGADLVASKSILRTYLDNCEALDEMTYSECVGLAKNVYAPAVVGLQFLNFESIDPTILNNCIQLLESTQDDPVSARVKAALQAIRANLAFSDVSRVYHFTLSDLTQLPLFKRADVAPAVLIMEG